MKFARDFLLSKTTLTALAAILAAVAAWAAGKLTGFQAAMAIFAALQSAFIRDTLAKGTETIAAAAGMGPYEQGAKR